MPYLSPEVTIPGQKTLKTENFQTDLLERVKDMEANITQLKDQVKVLQEEKMELMNGVDFYVKKYGPQRRRCTSKRKNFKIKIEKKEEDDCKIEKEQK